jgi:hypothetical protein
MSSKMHPDGSTSAPLVLVPGVSGFLGAHCAQQLLAACWADSRPLPAPARSRLRVNPNPLTERRAAPNAPCRTAGRNGAAFNEGAGDLGRMFLYFRSGRYVADSTLHEELLGPVPTGEDAVRRWAEEKGLIAG